jgi:hypothetical protein
MDRSEKAKALIERAEKRGLRLGVDCGVLVANRDVKGDHDEIIEDLVKYLSEVHVLVKRRSLAARAKAFLGQRVCLPDGFTLGPYGEGVISGVISGASNDGSLDVAIEKEGFRSPQTMKADAENLLIIRDEEEADGAASAHSDEPQSEQPRKGFFERLRGSREE